MNTIQALVLAILMLALGCSGGSSGFRTSGSETSSNPNGSNVADSSNRPRDEGVTPDEYTTAAIPNPLTGSNLVDVLVSASCVIVSGKSTPCTEVRLSAKIKVDAAKPVRFAVDTVNAFGIVASSWKISEPTNVSCLSKGDGYDFYPKCTSKDGASLARVVIEASLTISAKDSVSFIGNSPSSPPAPEGAIFGNFMLMEASAGFTPSQIEYPRANRKFSEIWQDLVSGHFITNALSRSNNGSNFDISVQWQEGINICNGVDSGDGVSKWRVPSLLEFCGSWNGDYANNCPGGFSKHGIETLKMGEETFSMHHFFWTATELSNQTEALAITVFDGRMHHQDKVMEMAGVLCVR